MAPKKTSGLSAARKRKLIECGHRSISKSRQCALLDLPRSSLYYEARPVSQTNLDLMRRIDEIYLELPMYGKRRMKQELARRGFRAGKDRVARLMRLMGLEAIYPKPRLSANGRQRVKFPYLLKDMVIDQPNQVWATDITYIPLRGGYAYLVAIMDWYSRYVIEWELSNTLEADFCVRALERALERGRPAVFNSDQGSQFTSEAWVDTLKGAGVRISMDGRGRVFDNIIVERLWRTVKYEEVYLRDYRGVLDAMASLERYFIFYNSGRIHSALDYRTPASVYAAAA
jgi:putative transposase